MGEKFASHQTVVHSQDEYVRGDAHTNTAEGYFSILKRGIYGIYQHVSEEHLHRYLAEFDFRYNHRIALESMTWGVLIARSKAQRGKGSLTEQLANKSKARDRDK